MNPNEMEKELIEHQTITTIVENVEAAKAEVEQGFALVIAAQNRLKAVIGSSGLEIDSYDLRRGSMAELSGKCRAQITKQAWGYILDQTGLRHYMTERRQKELREQIDKGQLPDMTVENILGTLRGLADKIDGLLLESVKEVFDWLRPQNDWGNGKLKTNHKFFVGEKAIVWAVERNYSGGFRANYHRDGNFRALGNVFSILDGKGVLKYPHDFYTRFNEAMTKAGAGDKYEDEYFECKCFGNGNLHIKFKRLDLLAKLNQMGSDGSLVDKEKAA